MEILELAAPESYAYDEALDGIENAVLEIKRRDKKVPVYYASTLRTLLEKAPIKHSEIVGRILSQL